MDYTVRLVEARFDFLGWRKGHSVPSIPALVTLRKQTPQVLGEALA